MRNPINEGPSYGRRFFQFLRHVYIFQFMFSWDSDEQISTPSGDVLSKFEAFYNSSEFTDREVPHGHSLAWLFGGSSPSNVRQNMCDGPGFQRRFLRFFFEDDIEMDQLFEPGTERPQHRRSHWHALLIQDGGYLAVGRSRGLAP